jgi:DNA-binding SARP family transcriptional activator/pimeloyl-ACP methyl ester carboxylesterase
MLVRVLGEVALESADGTPVPLPGARQPALLAALVARRGVVLTPDRLADLVWGDDQPANPAAALHSAVFKLRDRLAHAGAGDVLVRRGSGYSLDVAADDVDAGVFAREVERATRLPAAEAADALGEALALWRGGAYGASADTEVAHLDAIRLEELRRTATEAYGAALVDSGRSAEAVALLRPFVAEHPLREAGRRELMRALHAVGRTAEALDHFHEHRRHLAAELGLEPSPALRDLQAALLRDAGPAPSSSTPATDVGRPSLQGMQVHYLRASSGRVLAHGTTGTGAPLVVLLGWISSLDVIASGRDPRSSLLERLTGDLALTLYDRYGTGLSPGAVDDYGLEAGVAELEAVVGEVGGPVSLLAMSAAGPIALAMAHRHPQLVSSLVLFGTLADAPRTFPDERLRDMVVELARSHWGVGSKMLADLYRPGLSDEAAWHLARVFRDSAGPDVAASYLEALYEQDVSHLLPDIDTPALVLHYRSDRLIDFSAGRALAAGLPNSTLLALDGRVHLPDVKDLDVIERAVVDHVRRHASANEPGAGRSATMTR